MLDPHLRLEPLAVAVDQGDRRHRNAADAGRDADQIVEALLRRALADIRDGDILMAHLGIWSRKAPFAPMLDPLIAGLKARGLCFATLAAAGRGSH